MPPIAVRWTAWPRILAEDLRAGADPLALLLRPGVEAHPAAVVALAAGALIGSEPREEQLPEWLAPHQVPAVRRLLAIVDRYGGALLADAVGLGKSHAALGVAFASHAPLALVVPAVLAGQWRALLSRYGVEAPIITHERLSTNPYRPLPPLTASDRPCRLLIVDEAHRFRNPLTNRYRALSMLAVGARVLLVTATPIHNHPADLFHLFRLFLRDDALAGLGLPSLTRAAAGDARVELAPAIVARLTVARSRQRVRAYPPGRLALSFPERQPARLIRAGALPDTHLERTVSAIRAVEGGAGAGALLRLLFLARLASSAPALLESVARYEAYVDLAAEAARQGRSLDAREFHRLFRDRERDALQLAFLPLLLAAGTSSVRADDLERLAAVRELASGAADPKAAKLEEVLARSEGKTIVFATARATVRYLARRLGQRRAAPVVGDRQSQDLLRAFAPRAQGVAPPPAALETDLLIATDLLSEGLNLQDANRVIHYDLPWSPARLAQRLGRIDRLGSAHATVETVTFLPPPPLAEALRLEERLAAKTRAQVATTGMATPDAGLDWCDRLQALAQGPAAARGAFAAVAGDEPAVVLVVRLGALVEAVVVDRDGARPDPVNATRLLELGATGERAPADGRRLTDAIERAAPLLRSRLNAIAGARWRAADRDRPGRRLVPSTLAAAQLAARRGDREALARIDALVSRLAAGMTAGEELELMALLERPAPLVIGDLLAWQARLPPIAAAAEPPEAELVAALLVTH